ncbi:MAG: hypothetical protein P9X22_07950 [Candidatus Zapsychrus exili]|nr:hypothetical protein [Candidatus Zapsychrus exili]
MNNLYGKVLVVLICAYVFIGCDISNEQVKKIAEGYQVNKSTEINVTLMTALNSNENKRGDQLVVKLRNPLLYGEEVVLPKETEIRGLIKRATKFEKIGDRANLVLLFDQLVISKDFIIPIIASLDTDQGLRVMKIEGKTIKNASIVGGSAVVGALVGKNAFGEKGSAKGLAIGTIVGLGSIMISDMKEISIPSGTELIIKFDEPVTIPEIKQIGE